MCIVSNVYDHYNDRWSTPRVYPTTYPPQPSTKPISWPWGEDKSEKTGMPSKEDIEDFYRILKKARDWDIAHNEPDCESAEKKKKLLEMAEEFGIEIEFT